MSILARFPYASKTFLALNPPVSPAEHEQNQAEPLGETVPGEKESLGRVTVCYRGFFVRPQDPDNFVAATKDITDGLWRCGLVHGDNKWQIELRHNQEQVAHFAQERVEIKIIYPNPKSRQGSGAKNGTEAPRMTEKKGQV